MKGNILLDVKNISKSFFGVKALKNIQLQVATGEVHAIVGENGAGKSTLMNILSGVFPPDSGEILFDNQIVHLKDPKHSQDLGISMIHQELSLATNLSVMENVFVGKLKTNRFGFVKYKEMRQACEQLFHELGITEISPTQFVSDLSISEMQMIEIAKALSYRAKLIIMDEPSASLTNKETEMLLNIIRKLKANGVSILYISHRMEEVFTISDRITVFRDGEYIKTLMTKETNPSQVVSLMVGREFNQLFHRERRRKQDSDSPILEVKNLSFKGHVNKVSFELYPGEVLAITGLVGAGRTELIETIFGVHKLSAGEMILEGQKVHIDSPRKAIDLGMGLVPEGRKIQGLFMDMTVRENISMAKLQNLSKNLFIGKKREIQDSMEYVSKLKVKTPNIEQKVKYLSGGNQQKTIIARWLLNHPKVLFLDEPTHGVDIGAKMEIYEIIGDLAKKGVGVVLISSELPEVLMLADRILVLRKGSVAGELITEEADQEAIMQLATGQFDPLQRVDSL